MLGAECTVTCPTPTVTIFGWSFHLAMHEGKRHCPDGIRGATLRHATA